MDNSVGHEQHHLQMKLQPDSEYAIIGGGVAGLSMAIALRNQGKDVTVYEQSPVLRGVGAGFGLAANAMQAFEYLGLRSDVEQLGYYTQSYAILNHRGQTLLAPDTERLSSRYQQKNFTVHRADLHRYLLSKLPAESVVLNKRIRRCAEVSGTVSLTFEDDTTARCRHLIVADGVKSAIRQQLLPAAIPRYAGYTCWRATISQGDIALPHGSETWGPTGRFGMTPLTGDRIYWYACINGPENSRTFRNYTVNDLLRHFGKYHEPIPEILHHTTDADLLWNDIIDIKPLKRFAFGNIVLIGDAAHATTPNMGQGACQALEDVAVLSQEIQRSEDIRAAFKRFELRRLSRTRYITQTSAYIGRAAQFTHPALIAIRNRLMRLAPDSWSQAPLKKLLEVDFMASF